MLSELVFGEKFHHDFEDAGAAFFVNGDAVMHGRTGGFREGIEADFGVFWSSDNGNAACTRYGDSPVFDFAGKRGGIYAAGVHRRRPPSTCRKR